MTDEQQVRRAEEYGRQARRGGKRTDANPYRGNTPLVRSCHDSWLRGWQSQDSATKAQAGRG